MQYLTALILAVGQAGATPPDRTPDEPALWLPGTAGDTLVFEETWPAADGTINRRITRKVLSVDRKDDRSVIVSIGEQSPQRKSGIVRRDEEAGVQTVNHVYLQNTTGLFLMMRDLEILEPPCCVLRLPLKAGDTWEVNNPAIFPAAITYTTGEEEEIEVPAGKFKAVRIERRSVLRDAKTIRVTEWAVSGMGAVKSRARLSDGTEVVQVLRSFSPGKK